MVRRGLVHHESALDAGHLLDFVQVGADHLAAQNGTPHERGILHARQLHIDGIDRLAGQNVVQIRRRLRMPDDLVVRRIFQLEFAQIGRRRHPSHFGRQFAIAGRAARRGVQHASRCRRALGFRHAPGFRRSRDKHGPSGGAHLPHGKPVSRRRGAASGALPVVFGLVVIGLLHLDALPIDVQFLGDQHGQHRLHALAHLRILGDDSDRAVRHHRDVVVRLRGSGHHAAPLRAGFPRRRQTEHHAAPGQQADLQKGTALQQHIPVLSAFHRRSPYPYSRCAEAAPALGFAAASSAAL